MVSPCLSSCADTLRTQLSFKLRAPEVEDHQFLILCIWKSKHQIPKQPKTFRFLLAQRNYISPFQNFHTTYSSGHIYYNSGINRVITYTSINYYQHQGNMYCKNVAHYLVKISWIRITSPIILRWSDAINISSPRFLGPPFYEFRLLARKKDSSYQILNKVSR